MVFIQIFFAVALGLASLGSIIFVLINVHLHNKTPVNPQMTEPAAGAREMPATVVAGGAVRRTDILT
jgi:hypothetical protein